MYRIFSSRYRTVCNFENFNNHIGVPLTAFRMEEETEAGIFEMGMNHSGEIHLLADIVRPQTAAVTNIGTSHIGNLGSRENIMKAKMEITDFMDGSSALVYNADNDKLSALKERYYRNFRKFSAKKRFLPENSGGKGYGRECGDKDFGNCQPRRERNRISSLS